MNNSLAPIKSIAGSLTGLLNQDPPPEDLHDDLHRGLEVVGSRADSLDRFLGSYARLTKLPKPDRKTVGLTALVDRVIGLETRLSVETLSSAEVELSVDAAQLEQVLINLIRNAVDAAGETADPRVAVGWSRVRGELELTVTDNGPGLASDANLFVPFFTTKPTGSGIGLALSRQIVEAHNGSLELRNREEGSGCVAMVRLPLK